MDSNNPNPARKTAAEKDYQKKFNYKSPQDKSADDVNKQEEAPDSEWKDNTSASKEKDAGDKKTKGKWGRNKQGKFGFIGRNAGRVQNGSAVAFITGILLLGVWYTSIFAPNIILVNLKEMYTNDLADATIALNTYYWKMMNYKIGRSNCGEKDSIKCKLSTMSRAQKAAFEKQGFFVMGSKVQEDNRDDMLGRSNDSAESRYQVSAVTPPVYAGGVPMFTGDMLWAYSELNTQTKALVYSVFNPKSSFFMDARFSQRLKTKYDLTKSVTVAGTTESAVNKSFDSSMTGGAEGIGMDTRPNTTGGIGLGSLRSPATIAQLEAAMMPMVTTNVNSFGGLQCAWYAFGKAVTNNAKSAKAHTLARFAMNYLKAADQIKVGTEQDVAIGTLSSKLAQGTFGGYTSANALDDTMYKHIVYGDLPIPSVFGILYYLDTFDLIGALLPSWALIMSSAAAVGTASNLQGSLTMPPGNLNGADRQYCLGAETEQNHIPIKEESCQTAAGASSPFGPELAEGGLEAGWQTCPKPQMDERHPGKTRGEWLTQPSLKATAEPLSPLVAGVFGVNVVAWANVMYQLFTSNTKGVAASNAIFAGTGEILGDMAMSRGMMPSNALSMTGYLVKKKDVEKDFEDVARYNAKKSPFDVYNKYSFLGSIVNGLQPTYNNKTPLFSSLANLSSLVGSAVKQVNKSANAVYFTQPDPFNPIRLTMCPDPEYWAIMIMADVACNVRYSMGPQELTASIDSVLDYMLKEHPDLTQKNVEELTERQAQADQEGDAANVGRMLARAQSALNQPQIDKKTGKAIAGSEYEKYLEYCVNRQDPWGRSAVATLRTELPDQAQRQRQADKDGNGNAVSPADRGDPYQVIGVGYYPAVSEGASADQDWYSGKKCTEQSEELTNFRAYTMICSVDGSLSGAVDCTKSDNSNWAGYGDSFYTSNDILYLSWF